MRDKALLALEILTAYGRVRWHLRRAQLPEVVASLRAAQRAAQPTRKSPRRMLDDPARDGTSLGSAVSRTLDLLPFDSRCLMRSLVLLELLARRGADGKLLIAVQKPGQLDLAAHAWIELDGRPLLTPAGDGYRQLTAL